ncbi:MAG: helix-turn-helix protein [Gemmataceae bacterium]|nr:helix-turn-helix protein [Gemmataceae bacterium]
MNPLMTKAEACDLLRVSSRTLDRWRSMWKSRKLNPLGEVKIRKQPRFQRASVEKLFSTPKLWLQGFESQTGG